MLWRQMNNSIGWMLLAVAVAAGALDYTIQIPVFPNIFSAIWSVV
jgi:hypothetical protein